MMATPMDFKIRFVKVEYDHVLQTYLCSQEMLEHEIVGCLLYTIDINSDPFEYYLSAYIEMIDENIAYNFCIYFGHFKDLAEIDMDLIGDAFSIALEICTEICDNPKSLITNLTSLSSEVITVDLETGDDVSIPSQIMGALRLMKANEKPRHILLSQLSRIFDFD